MADLNLIPPDYTRQLKVRRAVLKFLCFLGALVLLGVAARIALGMAINYEQARAEKLKSGEVLMLEQKKEYEELTAKKEQLQLRLDMLEHLRGGPPAREMFIAVDRAINESVWFTKLSFSRADEEGPESKKGTATGYFIVVPKEETKGAPETLPLNSGQVSISGMALSHSALADFVNVLVAQPLVRSVQVQNTHSRQYLEGPVIEYELTAVMITDTAKR